MTRDTAREDAPASVVPWLLSELFAGDPRVTPPAPGGGRFGARGVKVDGKVFAMEWQGQLAVKLPAARVGALTEQGAGLPLQMGARRMSEWFVARDPTAWAELAREARDFVGP